MAKKTKVVWCEAVNNKNNFLFYFNLKNKLQWIQIKAVEKINLSS